MKTLSKELKLQKLKKEFIWVERISYLLDNRFHIGGFRFGLDPLLNLIPFAGQSIAFGTSILLVIIMLRHGVGSKVAVKMLLNVIYDALFGSIPIIGQVFDFFNKANQKNIVLLREHYFEDKHQGSAKRLLIGIFVFLLLFCLVVFYLIWLFSAWFVTILNALF